MKQGCNPTSPQYMPVLIEDTGYNHICPEPTCMARWKSDKKTNGISIQICPKCLAKKEAKQKAARIPSFKTYQFPEGSHSR